MKKLLLFTSLIIITLIQTSCDWFTFPEELEPGRRDYVWTADTLDLVMNDFQSIWGSSPEDVWVGTNRSVAYHFNGSNWTEHNEIRNTSRTIYGFSQNDIWLGGSNGKILHYDGNTWSENFTYSDNKFDDATIRDFVGINSNNLYAVGYTFTPGYYNDWTQNQRAFILHYNGYQWEEKFFADFQSQFIKILELNNVFYILNVTVDNTTSDTTKIIRFTESQQKIDTILSANGILVLNKIDNLIYIINNNKIFTLSDKTLNETQIPEITDMIYQVYGRHKNDLLIRTRNYIVHYNGMDNKYLYEFPNEWVGFPGGAIVFNEDIFFNCSDYQNKIYYVLHGKLN